MSAELVRGIMNGDKAAEEELFCRYRKTMSFVIWKIIRRDSLTPDLCHEAFLIAFEKIRRGGLREPDKLSGFMLGIARNVSLAYLRGPHNREIGIEDSGDLYERSPDQYDHLLGQEITDIARRTLTSLKSKRDREILRRFYIEENSKEEICSDLGLTNGQFHLVLHRAKKQFEKLYRKTLAKMQSKSEGTDYRKKGS